MAPTLTVLDDAGAPVVLRERALAAQVRAALAAAGVTDDALGDELAAAVWTHLARAAERGATPPALRAVEEMAARALSDAGYEEAAEAFARERRRRSRLRDELLVVPESAASSAEPAEPGSERAAPWDPAAWARVVADETDLPAALADELAASVEGRLAALGFDRVAERLVRELLQAELGARGLTGDLVRRGYALDAREAARASESETAPPEEIVGTELLARAALDFLPPAVAAAHRGGLLHAFGLGRPAALERLALSAALLLGEGTAQRMSAARTLLRARAALDRLRPHAAGVVELPDLVGYVASRATDGDDPREIADDLFSALIVENAFGAPVGPIMEVVVPLDGFAPGRDGVRERAVVRAFAERAGATPHLRPGLRVVFSTDGGAADDADVAAWWPVVAATLRARPDAALAARREGDLDPFLRDPAAPAARRLRLSPVRTGLNLPLALAAVRGGGLRDALAALAPAARLVHELFHDALWRQRRGAPYGVHGVVVMCGGPAAVAVEADGQEADLEIWGLPLALELLVRRGVFSRAHAAEAAARILGALDYAAGEERNGIGLRVRLGGVRERDVRVRFHAAYERHARERGDRDALEALKRTRGGEGVLPVVPPLFDARNAPLFDVPCASRLGPGLAVGEAALPEGLVPGLCRDLVRSSRLNRLAIAPPGAGDGLFEVQEELFR
jgi:hypothetical protein